MSKNDAWSIIGAIFFLFIGISSICENISKNQIDQELRQYGKLGKTNKVHEATKRSRRALGCTSSTFTMNFSYLDEYGVEVNAASEVPEDVIQNVKNDKWPDVIYLSRDKSIFTFRGHRYNEDVSWWIPIFFLILSIGSIYSIVNDYFKIKIQISKK